MRSQSRSNSMSSRRPFVHAELQQPRLQVIEQNGWSACPAASIFDGGPLNQRRLHPFCVRRLPAAGMSRRAASCLADDEAHRRGHVKCPQAHGWKKRGAPEDRADTTLLANRKRAMFERGSASTAKGSSESLDEDDDALSDGFDGLAVFDGVTVTFPKRLSHSVTLIGGIKCGSLTSPRS